MPINEHGEQDDNEDDLCDEETVGFGGAVALNDAISTYKSPDDDIYKLWLRGTELCFYLKLERTPFCRIAYFSWF